MALALATGAQAQVNDPPALSLPSPLPVTPPQTVVGVGIGLTDPDAGAGSMTLSFSISDIGGVFTPAEVGAVTWTFGAGVTSDTANGTLAQLQAALAGMVFMPAPGYAGTARIQMTVNDNGNTGSGGARTDTLQMAIKVCTAAEVNDPVACANNNPPVNAVLVPAPDTQPQTTVAVPWAVSDVDVGAGTMQMEINVAHHGGALTPAETGTISWAFGNNVTNDTAEANQASINTALAGLTFRPANGFAGTARLVFEIDDRKNSGVGDVDPLADTDFIVIDVCAPAELGTAACAINNNPVNVLPGTTAWTTPSETPLAIPFSVDDPDVGPGQMQMELNLVDADAVVTPAEVGSLSWSFGNGVTADAATTTRTAMNAALATLVFTPHPTFTGTARLVMEIDDRGNSGSAGIIASDTDFRDIPVTPRAGSIQVASACTRLAGEGTTISFRVRRLDGDDGAGSAQVVLTGISATLGSDFQLVGSSTLTWADQDRTDRIVSVTIAGDALSEPVETFTFAVQAPTGVAIGNPSLVTVRIDPALTGDIVRFQDGFETLACP
jgi:hypothetical protein